MEFKKKKCPECGAAIKASAIDGQYHCEYCGSSFDIVKAEQEQTSVVTTNDDAFDASPKKKKIRPISYLIVKIILSLLAISIIASIIISIIALMQNS